MTSGRKRSPRTANAVSISLTCEEEKRGKGRTMLHLSRISSW